MKLIKALLKTPYPYIFLLGYWGVWLIWDGLKLPFTDPNGIISYLPLMHYNPSDNIFRFLAAILIPPAACLAYWIFTEAKLWQKIERLRYLKNTAALFLIGGCLVLALAMGITQGSTNPANNPVGEYGGPYSHAVVDTFHEGETLGPAISYEQKDLKPYKNFVIIHGVFQDPLRSVIAFKLFGKSIGAERAFSVILLMLTFVLYYVLLLVLFKRNLIKAAAGLGILALLLMPALTLPTISNYLIGVQMPFRDIATILFFILAVVGCRYALSKRKWALSITSLLIGFLVVVGYANSIDRAFYITALSALWLVMIFVLTKPKDFLKQTFLPFVVGCLLGLPILGLALKWAFGPFLTYLITMGHYKDYLDAEIFTKPTPAQTVVLLVIGIGIAIGGFWLIKTLREANFKKGDNRHNLTTLKEVLAQAVSSYHTYIIIFVAGVIYMRSAIGRADVGHFAYSVQWLYLFLVYLGIELLFSRYRKYKRALGFITVLIFSFVVLFYVVQVKHIDVANDTFPIHLSDKLLVPLDYQQTANYLKANLHGQDTFVSLTSEGIWYYLVDKASPITYPIIWYAYTHPERQLIANQIQNNSHIKFIVTNTNWTSDFDFVPNPVRFPEVYKVLDQLYVPYKGFGQQTIWIRK